MIVFLEISGDVSETEIGIRIKQVLGEPYHPGNTKKATKHLLPKCFTAY
jgi:hypothetical protein